MTPAERFLTLVREGVDADALQPWLASRTRLAENAADFVAPLRTLDLEQGRGFGRFDSGLGVLDPALRPPVVSPVNLRLYAAVVLLADAPTCGDSGGTLAPYAFLGAMLVDQAWRASRPLRFAARDVVRSLSPRSGVLESEIALRLADHLLADALTVPDLEQLLARAEVRLPGELDQSPWIEVLSHRASAPVRASAPFARLIRLLAG